MSRKQKRYASLAEIAAAIRKYQAKIPRLLDEAESFDVAAGFKLMEADLPSTTALRFVLLSGQADTLRATAVKLRRSCLIIEEKKIPALIRTAAAFQTRLLSFTDDEGVVLQK